MSVTTAIPDQFKLDLLTIYGLKASGGIVCKIALIKAGATGTYDKTVTNYGTGSGSPTSSNMGTDEVANGSGYTTGGVTLTNVDSILSTDTAVASFGANPSWTSASFSTIGCEIYTTNSSLGTAGRPLYIGDFGGTQTVASGTFTLIVPTQDATNGLIRCA
jgi:hypothetical protein